MKRKKALIPVLTGALLLTMGLAACGGKKGGEGGGNTSSEVQEVKINITSEGNKKEIQVGETLQLQADVDGVEWSTRNTEYATVNASGLVTAVAPGSARITAKKEGYANGTFTVTIVKAPERAWKYELRLEEADHYDPDDFWGIDYRPYGYDIVMGPGDSPVEDNGGKTDDGTSLGYLQTGCKETMKFTSDKAVRVELGVTMAYNAETALNGVISVKFNNVDVSMASAVCEGPEDGDTNNYYDFHGVSFGMVDLIAGENVLEIEVLGQVAPNMDKVVIWTEDTLQITSVPAPQKEAIVVSPTEKELIVDETVQLVTETAGVTYESSAPTVASVNATGLVTALSAGKATITISKEGMKKATVAITVKAKPVAGQIVLEAEDAVLPEGTSIQFENGDNCSGGKSLGYFSAEQSFELKYTAAEAKTYKLSMVASSAVIKSDYSGFDAMTLTNEVMTMKLNNTVIDLGTNTLPATSGWTKTWTEIDLGEVSLIQGENVFSFVALSQGPNIDCLKLTDPNAGGQDNPPAPTTYAITFAAGEGASGEMAAVQVEAGEYTLPECTFTAPAGMAFAGWSIPSANWWESAQIKQAGEKINVSGALTITATWLKENVAITFNANGGTGEMAAVQMAPGEYTLPECTFVAPGTKVFAGWEVTTYTEYWGQVYAQTAIKQPGEKINVSDDMEIKASWKVVITKSTQIDLSGAFVMEAEDATIVGAQTQQGGSPVENNESSSGGKDVGYMAKDASITFNFNASAAGQAKLVLMGRSANADWSNWQNPVYYDHALEETTSIKVNGVDVDVTGKGFLAADARTSVQVDLGNVAVSEGPNTIVITALAQAPNFDCIALVSEGGAITFTLPA